MDRNIANGILVKLGVENPDRFDDERAAKKIVLRIGKDGRPADLTVDEAQLLEELGIGADGKPEAGSETPVPAKATGKAGKQPASASKAPKVATGTKKAPALKSDGKAEGNPAVKRSSVISDIFRNAFKAKSTTKKIDKEALRAQLLEAGCKPGTANSYFAWVKRQTHGQPGPGGNPWPFVAKEVKDEKTGVKSLFYVKDFPAKATTAKAPAAKAPKAKTPAKPAKVAKATKAGK